MLNCIFVASYNKLIIFSNEYQYMYTNKLFTERVFHFKLHAKIYHNTFSTADRFFASSRSCKILLSLLLSILFGVGKVM